jgi:Zn-dependent M16 (insulinase) family peptidase
MPVIPDINNPHIENESRKLDFQIETVSMLNEINSVFYMLTHRPTGARLVHISNQDKENTFSVAFKTVPADSTGVAHILEHTVLCGSRKFPVRDPFFSMLKRSLSTFMNAFTASDWTMYPFSTQNKKDYYNLMDVYLDASFYPTIDKLSFKQEGHRLEVEDDPESEKGFRLVYKGVVYNEMKGAMSSPDQVMARSLLNAMYPDTTYRFNSGGDPAVIPKLSYEQLKVFHARHYHPSNSFFYTYGNLPLMGHLSLIHEKVLRHFGRIDPKTEVQSQPRWRKARKAVYSYPLGAGEDPSKKAQVCVAWLTSDIKDAFQILVLKLLEQILIGNAASPLRKALIDSELGTALSDTTGFDAENRDTFFSCGLKDVHHEDAEKIESIVLGVLNDLAKKGVDRKQIDSAIHQIEFHRKEITNSPYPYGIKLLLTFIGSWLHGGNPEKILRFDDDLERLRSALEESAFFEKQIQRFFIKNPHRVLFTLKPDPLLEKKEDEMLRSELAALQSAMDPAKLLRIREDAAALKKLQETDEDSSRLPTLALADIPPDVHAVQPSGAKPAAAATCYNQPTSGIFYFNAAIGIEGAEARLLPLIPFFCYALPKIGTRRRDFIQVVQDIDLYTGGMGLSVHAHTPFGNRGSCMPFVSIHAKCLKRNLSRLFDLLAEVAFEAAFSNSARLKSLLLEYRAGLESMIVHSGHRYAISLASRTFSPASYLSEIWSGIHQLRFVKQLTENLQADRLASIGEDLSLIGGKIMARENMEIALVGETDSLERCSDILSQNRAWSGNHHHFPSENTFKSPPLDMQAGPSEEGWSTSTAVSFVAETFKTVRMDHEDAPRLSVISKLLRSLYLHREIREKGGAYGAFANYNFETGLFSFASYRDPHILSTLAAFQGAAGFVASGAYGDEDIKEAILQVCSEMDKPDPPGPAARKAFYRKIIFLSDEFRRCFKARLLSLTWEEVIRTAKKYFSQKDRVSGVAVISSEERLASVNEKRAEGALRLYRI